MLSSNQIYVHKSEPEFVKESIPEFLNVYKFGLWSIDISIKDDVIVNLLISVSFMPVIYAREYTQRTVLNIFYSSVVDVEPHCNENPIYVFPTGQFILTVRLRPILTHLSCH